MKKTMSQVLLYVIVSLGAIIMLLPFLWMISTSLKTSTETIKIPPIWIPKVLRWANYVE
ncbi:carbohydrate ABC transporter permease, partial [Lactobacillus sp. XV13L]|nr:carbohydrate ABC transporter permease [Lactobacillus sp. XV13L]